MLRRLRRRPQTQPDPYTSISHLHQLYNQLNAMCAIGVCVNWWASNPLWARQVTLHLNFEHSLPSWAGWDNYLVVASIYPSLTPREVLSYRACCQNKSRSNKAVARLLTKPPCKLFNCQCNAQRKTTIPVELNSDIWNRQPQSQIQKYEHDYVEKQINICRGFETCCGSLRS